jgi:hypothetical protein
MKGSCKNAEQAAADRVWPGAWAQDPVTPHSINIQNIAYGEGCSVNRVNNSNDEKYEKNWKAGREEHFWYLGVTGRIILKCILKAL